MRLHQVMAAAARAEIAEQNRRLQASIENDPFVIASEVGTIAATGLAVGKKMKGMSTGQLEANKKWLWENHPDQYKEIYGGDYVAPAGRKKLFGGDGVFDGSLLGGLFKRKDDPVIKDSDPAIDLGNDMIGTEVIPGAQSSEFEQVDIGSVPKVGSPVRGTVSGTVVPNDGEYGNLVESVNVDGQPYNPTYTFAGAQAEDEFTKAVKTDRVWDTPPGQKDSTVGLSGKTYNNVTDWLEEVEDYRGKSYWDVDAWRYGYGTDTFITAEGDSVSVTRRGKMSRISKEEAKKQLEIQIEKTFRKELRTKFGKDYYNSLPKGVRMGLESLAYNAGSDLNDTGGKIKKAIKDGDFNKAADLIAGQVPEGHTLYNRRQQEAAFVRSGGQGSIPGPVSLDNEKSWMISANKLAANMLGFDNTAEYRTYMNTNVVERDAAGNVVGFNANFINRLNGYIDTTLEYIESTKVAQSVQQYNEILRREKDYELGFNPNTLSPIGNNNPGQTMEMSE
tara:strand:+ start:30 stop:1541 length:1512 start_codon:yes stop_codon:yes gene_type:complete